jgi:hypothetical protein
MFMFVPTLLLALWTGELEEAVQFSGWYETNQGLILQNSILAGDFPDKFSSSNFGQFSTQNNNIYKFILGIMDNNL